MPARPGVCACRGGEIEQGDADRKVPRLGRAPQPQQVEHADELQGVLGFQKRHCRAPPIPVPVLDREVQATRVVAGVTQPHGRFLEQPVQRGMGALLVPQLGGQGAWECPRLLVWVGGRSTNSPRSRRHMRSPSMLPPDAVQVRAGRGGERGDRGDATGPETLFQVGTNARQVPQGQWMQHRG